MRQPHSTRRHWASFAAAGTAGFVVDAGGLWLGLAAGLGPGIARVPAFGAAVLTTWAINRTFTFATPGRPNLPELGAYLAAMSVGLAVNMGAYLAILRLSETARDWPILALIPAILTGMTVNYLGARRVLGHQGRRG